MRQIFVETANYLAFMDALDALDARGADECRLVVVDGLPGLGKTTILERWAGQGNGVYLRAKTEWSPYWLMAELLQGLKIRPSQKESLGAHSFYEKPPHGHEARFNACLEMLAERLRLAESAGKQFAVVIDEADHVTGKGKLVDTLRDLADLSGVPFILVGMGRVRDNLTRFPQTASRISRYVRFEPADLGDVEKFLAAQCEVPVARDLAEFVRQATRGFNREIREAIVAVGRKQPGH